MSETFELTDGTSSASIVPARGGLVSSFRVAGEEQLFLDPATLADPSKNVRGGIPILFPFAGKPPPGSTLKQHGFARTLPWTVSETARSRLVCGLESGPQTRAAFPFEFRLELQLILAGTTLRLEFQLQNRGATPMPLHFGLHPYFAVPLEAKPTVEVETNATTAYDQQRGQTGPLPRLEFSGPELDLHLLDHSTPRTVLRAGGRELALEWSPNFTTLVLWTLPGQPFVCVEPWSAPTGTFGQRALAPGAGERFDFQIRAS